MNPDELNQIRQLIAEINNETTLDRDQITRVQRAMLSLMKSYKGATDRLYRLRERLRRLQGGKAN